MSDPDFGRNFRWKNLTAQDGQELDTKIDVAYIGGCLSAGIVDNSTDLLCVKAFCMHTSTIVLAQPPTQHLSFLSGLDSEIDKVLAFEANDVFVPKLREAQPKLILIDFIRDFTKPLIRYNGSYFSWYYQYETQLEAINRIKDHCEIIPPHSEDFKALWMHSMTTFAQRVKAAAPDAHLFVVVPRPAFLSMDLDTGTIRPLEQSFDLTHARLFSALTIMSEWAAQSIPEASKLYTSFEPYTSAQANSGEWAFHYAPPHFRLLGMELVESFKLIRRVSHS